MPRDFSLPEGPVSSGDRAGVRSRGEKSNGPRVWCARVLQGGAQRAFALLALSGALCALACGSSSNGDSTPQGGTNAQTATAGSTGNAAGASSSNTNAGAGGTNAEAGAAGTVASAGTSGAATGGSANGTAGSG